jgi:hypothetical protein
MTDTDEYRTSGVWPGRLMNRFEPLPAPRPPHRSRVRRAFAITGRIVVTLVVLGGVAFALAAATGQLYTLARATGL